MQSARESGSLVSELFTVVALTDQLHVGYMRGDTTGTDTDTWNRKHREHSDESFRLLWYNSTARLTHM